MKTFLKHFAAWTLGLSVYYILLVYLLKLSPVLELLLVLILPLKLYFGGKMNRSSTPRLLQLFWIESVFNISVLICAFSSYLAWDLGCKIGTWGILFFFVLQILGFLYASWQSRRFWGIVLTLLGSYLLICWAVNNYSPHSTYQAGRFLIMGEQMPAEICYVYCFWLCYMLFCDSQLLPDFTQASFQLSSLFVALLFVDFFHVRLLTASHSFLLDSLTGIFTSRTKWKQGLILPARYWRVFQSRFVPVFRLFLVIGVLACLFALWIRREVIE